MNQFRQSLEDLFNKEEMKQKIKDVEEYYNREVEDSRNNSIMNKLNELMGIRSAYANDTVLDQQPLENQPEVNNTAGICYTNRSDEYNGALEKAALYVDAIKQLFKSKDYYQNKKLNDKYKHAMINYAMAQNGPEYLHTAIGGSILKDANDLYTRKNTIKESLEDMQANLIGAYLGRKYSNGDSDTMVQQYYKKTY